MTAKRSFITGTDLFCGAGGSTSGAKKAGTVSTRDRMSLILPSPDINDCYYRMLKPHEIKAAMAFVEEYIVLGNSRDKVKQLGNAVTPPVMEWIISRCMESFKR